MKVAIAVLCFVQIPLSAEELTVRWREVPQSLVAGRKVEVRLTRGGVLRGKALTVTPDGLRMEIAKVGESLVPAGEIGLMKVNRNHIRGRVILTSVFGGLIGLGAGLAVAEGSGSSPTAGAVVMLAAFPAGGYALGWLLDRKSLTLRVVP